MPQIQDFFEILANIERRLDILERTGGGAISTGGSGGAVDSVNGETGVVVLDQDDVLDGTTNKQFSATEQTKLAGIEAGAEVNVGEEYTTAEKSKLSGIETGATADQSNAEIETAYNAQVAVATQAEAEAGTSTTVKRFTPERIKQAIAELSSSLKPYFEARLTTGSYSPTSDLIWDTEIVDNLGNYNNSNGIFTAPYDGFYVFGFNILLPNSPSGEFRVGFYKNNSIYNVPIWRKPNTGTWETIELTTAMYLTAGDNVRVKYTTGSSAIYTDSNYNRFWGFMV